MTALNPFTEVLEPDDFQRVSLGSEHISIEYDSVIVVEQPFKLHIHNGPRTLDPGCVPNVGRNRTTSSFTVRINPTFNPSPITAHAHFICDEEPDVPTYMRERKIEHMLENRSATIAI
jgi:hypothetical protein